MVELWNKTNRQDVTLCCATREESHRKRLLKQRLRQDA